MVGDLTLYVSVILGREIPLAFLANPSSLQTQHVPHNQTTTSPKSLKCLRNFPCVWVMLLWNRPTYRMVAMVARRLMRNEAN
jgi:hypothetical protein